jgi:hypothetical protein
MINRNGQLLSETRLSAVSFDDILKGISGIQNIAGQPIVTIGYKMDKSDKLILIGIGTAIVAAILYNK